MEFLLYGCDVVGWYRVHGDVISKPQLFAIMHDSSLADDLGTVGIRDYHCRRLFQLSDGYGVTVVEMLMRDKDIVSLGYFAVIGHRLQLAYRIHFYLPAVKGNADAAVFDSGEGDLLPAFRLDSIKTVSAMVFAQIIQSDTVLVVDVRTAEE